MLALLAALTMAAADAPAPKMQTFRGAAPADAHLSPRLRVRACGYWQVQPVKRAPPSNGPQNLGELPPANMEYTVLRLDENGCSVPVIVRENVSGDGRFANRD